MKSNPTLFEDYTIRRLYDETTETWFFSVVDVIQVLIQQPDFQAARNYWKVLKNRLKKEGSESVTKCNRLKLAASDGKSYLTDVATAETLLRLKELKDFDPLSKILHENLIAGYTRAATKCYFKQLDPKVRCPDYVIGHATMKTGTPRTKICTAAKRSATSPRGCQRKHCTPCTYDNI